MKAGVTWVNTVKPDIAGWQELVGWNEARLKKAAAYASMEALPAFLARLGLEAHLPALQEEELDVGLLRSMGRDELASNMASLGLSAADATRMADDLFPAAVVS